MVLEELEGRGELSGEQAAELAELRPKVVQWKQQKKEKNAKYRQELKAAADRVVVLEELEGQGELTGEQAAELAELRPKVVQWKQQEKASSAKYRQGLRAAADRVVVLEELAGQGPLTEEQEAELAALRPKVAQRGRKKQDRDVMDTGVGGDLLDGRDERIEGPEGVSAWGDFHLAAWLDQSVAGSAGSGDAGVGGAGVMLGEGAVEDVLATELTAFLGQDAGADDFAGFLPDYHDWADPVGLFGVEGPDEGPFGDPFPEDAVWPDGVWPDGVWPDAVGSGDRFVRGVNQASYLSGDARFRVNCLEACVAFHNSLKFGWQFVAGPAGDRDPVRLEVAFGKQAQRVEGVAGVEQYVRSGPVGVAVPVLYQRPDGSAHVINAVHTDSKDPAGHDVVVLWDPQRGEEAEKADVSAVTGMWVIPVPEAEPVGMVVLPSSGSGLRSQGWGSGLPTEVTGKAGPKGVKRTRGEADESARTEAGESSQGAKRRKVTAAAAGIAPGNRGNGGSEVLTPTDQPRQQDEREAERKQKTRAKDVKYYQGLRTAADRVAELEELAGQRSLTEEQAAELAALQPKAQRKQKKKEDSAKHYQARKAEAARVAELEELKGRGELTEEQAAELAALQPKVAQRKQKKKEDSAKHYQARKAHAARVAELEELKGRGS